ncbi:MAG: VWA domain-containing protein [Deltaproteobacteria bacterium]|nr:VWA domain-containing protein [Deltaproteobacteria bacterium]
MGYGSYSYEAHTALTTARSTRSRQEVFSQRECHPLMDPKGVHLREARDSAEHPESLGIAFALDVTGSMGRIPEQLAKEDLPQFMQLLGELGVAHPQVLFMGVGDAFGDRAPLQVGQFESTAELMDQWLTSCWIEGGGGHGDMESYELAMYFAARHVDMDCYRKRGQRGYLFLTGDEKPYPQVSHKAVAKVMGDELTQDIPTAAIVEELHHQFEPFFLIPDLERRATCERPWRDLLGDRVIALESPDDTCVVAASLIALGEGIRDLDGIVKHLRSTGIEQRRIGMIARALMPFASSVGRDGAPSPVIDESVELPTEHGGETRHRRAG